MINQLIHGDCLEIMPQLPDKIFDMILCDLPFHFLFHRREKYGEALNLLEDGYKPCASCGVLIDDGRVKNGEYLCRDC
ncbi:hypothetical protein [Sporosarcina sp. USHLN248]|uniref:hypothetical protein n=1 Tax=Sporosarcina sp. USHLN248 TaxID=3081300 RepID=UPI0030176A8A